MTKYWMMKINLTEPSKFFVPHRKLIEMYNMKYFVCVTLLYFISYYYFFFFNSTENKMKITLRRSTNIVLLY